MYVELIFRAKRNLFEKSFLFYIKVQIWNYIYSKIDYYKLITQLTVLLLILFHKINELLHAQVTCYAWTFTNYEVTYTLVSLDKARITMTYTYRYNDWTEHSVSMERTATWARFTISKTYSVTRILLRKTTTKTNTVYQVKQTKPKQSWM